MHRINGRMRPYMRFLDKETRESCLKASGDWRKFKPKWWKNCSSRNDVSFKAAIWGSTFYANYAPSKELGFQAVLPVTKRWVDQFGNVVKQEIVDIKVLVTWDPKRIGSSIPANGALAQKHNLTQGDLAEFIAWHELGHNYVSIALPKDVVVALFTKHSELYRHLQEFYADMTAIRHVSPRARRIPCMMRLNELDHNDNKEAHTRAARGIASVLLTEFMLHPEDWPSVHFPPVVPDKDIELNVIKYVYEHWDTKWSIKEDLKLREIAETTMRKQAKSILKSKGRIKLANKLNFNLYHEYDAQDLLKREAWIKTQLQKLISDGRADIKDRSQNSSPQRIDWPKSANKN